MVRIKHRYLLLQLLYPPSTTAAGSAIALYAPTPDVVTPARLLSTLRTQLAQLFGDMGAALASNGLKVMYWSNATSTAVVRCRREGVRLVWAAAAFVRAIATGKGRDVECVLRCAKVSGTVRKAEEEVLRRAREVLGRVRAVDEVGRGGLDVGRLVGGGREDDTPAEREVATGEAQTHGQALSDVEDVGVPVASSEMQDAG